MEIRKYRPSDCEEVIKLFYDTVHNINKKDYTKEQLDVWATGKEDLEKWNSSLEKHFTLVATNNGMIVGFGDIDRTGYLDRLYVHSKYQGVGIGSSICDLLEKYVNEKIVTHSSITAKTFFEKRGYKVVKKQQINRQGIILVNYVMEK